MIFIIFLKILHLSLPSYIRLSLQHVFLLFLHFSPFIFLAFFFFLIDRNFHFYIFSDVLFQLFKWYMLILLHVLKLIFNVSISLVNQYLYSFPNQDKNLSSVSILICDLLPNCYIYWLCFNILDLTISCIDLFVDLLSWNCF